MDYHNSLGLIDVVVRELSKAGYHDMHWWEIYDRLMYMSENEPYQKDEIRYIHFSDEGEIFVSKSIEWQYNIVIMSFMVRCVGFDETCDDIENLTISILL